MNTTSLKTIFLSFFFFIAPVLPAQLHAQDEVEEFELYFNEEQLVQTASRSSKPLRQVAENVTIITAAEIERMNAHGVADVLNRIAGVYIDYSPLDFNQSAYIHIQGSNWEHVVVLLDGVRVMKASSELAWVNLIPVRIIKRIEVIKGAASSSWGSALGGVINIITKDTGDSLRPQGDVVTSYGEKNTHDVSGELAGKRHSFSYYLYGGDQQSDGLRDDRFFTNSPAYGKLRLKLPENMQLEISGLSTRPQYQDTYWPAADFYQLLDDKNTFVSGRFDALVAQDLNLHIEAFRFDNDYRAVRHTISLPTTLLQDFSNDQKSVGGALRLDYRLGNHALMAGFDYQRNELQMTWHYRDGALWDLYYPNLAPMADYYAMDLLSEEVSGSYLNATLVFDKLTVTPGIRWDHISTVSSDVISPSLGLTYQLAADTLLRASASRGFRKPPVFYLEGDPLYSPTAINPNLEPEKNWTYQAGVESNALPLLHIKTSLFLHDVENTWGWAPDWSIFRINGERSTRQGIELEVSTRPIFHTSLQANFTYTHSRFADKQTDHSRTANIIVLFDHPALITAELSGHYIKWGDLLADGEKAQATNSFLWDLSLNKALFHTDRLGVSLFALLRNIGNNKQYVSDRWPNAPRYAELGLKIRF